MQLAERIELHRLSEDGPSEIDLEPHDLVDWTEGVEHLQSKTPEELYLMLGFKDGKIPFLVDQIDVEGVLAALPQADDVAPKRLTTMQPFAMKWHQLVAVVKMMECALTSLPVMLMDDVGIGKTLEVIAFFAVLAYYRKFYSETKRYPGIWGAYYILCDTAAQSIERHRFPGVDQLRREECTTTQHTVPVCRATIAHRPSRI
jgi:hypothetical protein